MRTPRTVNSPPPPPPPASRALSLLKRLTAVLPLLLLAAMVVNSQTSSDPRWFDGNPFNDPDDPNLCFTVWNCQTELDWRKGWQAARFSTIRISSPALGDPPMRVPPADNLCDTVWTCSTEAHQLRGWQRLQAIMVPPPTPVPVIINTPIPTAEPDDDDDDDDERTETIVYNWQSLTQAQILALDLFASVGELYLPPARIPASGTIIGQFRFVRESIAVHCWYWHNADQVPTTKYVKVGPIRINVDAGSFMATDAQLNCINNNVDEADVVARQWKITMERRYTPAARIRDVSWKLTAWYAFDEDEEPDDTCAGGTTCTKSLDATARTYLNGSRTATPVTTLSIPAAPTGDLCSGRYRESGQENREVRHYEITCVFATGELMSTLKFRFVHDKTRGFSPSPTPTQSG